MTPPAFDVTGIGEVMLRLSVPMGERLQDARVFDAHVGGAEANVLAALAQLGRRCAWFSALPETPLGRLVAGRIAALGVETSGVIWRENGRVGVNYVEPGAPPRPARVIYDRAGSCAAALTPDEIDWKRLLDTRLLHLTGITPALSGSCRAVTEAAVRQARERGVPFAFDINFRARLWGAVEAHAVLEPLIEGAHVLFCARGDAEAVFGLHGAGDDICRHLAERFGARFVVVSVGSEGAYGFDGAQIVHQPAFPVSVIDRIGAGDALAAGVLHGILEGDFSRGLRCGAALAALALSQHGDMVMTDANEVAALAAQGDAHGVQR